MFLLTKHALFPILSLIEDTLSLNKCALYYPLNDSDSLNKYIILFYLGTFSLNKKINEYIKNHALNHL